MKLLSEYGWKVKAAQVVAVVGVRGKAEQVMAEVVEADAAASDSVVLD